MHKEYRALWIAADYCPKMGSAEVCPPPAKEFIRLYHLTSAEYAISNIALRRMRLARYSDLNDPFELMALRGNDRGARTLVEGFKDDIDNRDGILCFSENWTNPVLWSHYGVKHRGICLGFDVLRTRTEKVLYQSDRITTELGDGETPVALSDELQALLRKTKFQHWHYEEERRVVVPLKNAVKEGANYFVQFDDTLRLAEVILGPACKMPLESVRQFVAAGCPTVTVIASRLAYGWFSVVPLEKTVS